MSGRAAKYPPIAGVGLEFHAVTPPSVPPPPPAPNLVLIPAAGWVSVISVPLAGFALTGKWSWHSVSTDGIGNILHGHDWGMGQPHFPVPPITLSPSIALLLLTSSTKYFLANFSVVDEMNGSAPGKEQPVALTTPAWMIPTQQCVDVSTYGFYLPLSICFQMPGTRHIELTLADLAAGVLGMVVDSAARAFARLVGGPAGPIGQEIGSAIVSNVTGTAINWVVGGLEQAGAIEGNEVTALKTALGVAAVLGGTGDSSDLAGNLAGTVFKEGGDWAGGQATDSINQGRGTDTIVPGV
jgi:hypothetical protein